MRSKASAALSVLGALSPSVSLLVGVLATAMAVDLAMLEQRSFSLAVTTVQTAVVPFWLRTVLRLEVREGSIKKRDMSRRDLWWHAVHVVIAGYCLFEKWRAALLPDGLERTQHAASYRIFSATFTLMLIVGLFGRGRRFARFFAVMGEQPARLMTLSFALTALAGGFLLTLPASLHHIESASFVDALFTATSAVCVTGLSVNTVSTTYTFFGQLVIAVLIQVGGIGIMVISSSLLILSGKRLRAKSGAVLAEMIDADSLASLRRTIRSIVVSTLAIEALGGLLLYASFSTSSEASRLRADDHAFATAHPAWLAAFHAISAFCNAGFALTHDNLVHFVGSTPVCSVIMLLIVLGGLGFPVLDELARAALQRARRRRPLRLSLHTRIAVVTSAGLIVAATVALAVLEWRTTLAALSVPDRLLAALFQSVSLRTAGFNTVDIGHFGAPTLLVCCATMFVGASPASTGGGLKTTTAAVLFAAFRAEMRGERTASLLDRTVPVPIINRAVAVAFVSLSLVVTVIFCLLVLEPQLEAMDIAFEVFSAFGTVGLSTGVTPQLSTASRLVIVLTMLMGRVGPLTIALAASRRGARPAYTLVEERVMIG